MNDAPTPRATVAIVQYRLLHYRVRLFELLRRRLAEQGIDLLVAHGQASPAERSRNDEGSFDGALRWRNRFWRVGGRDLVWHPLPRALRRADLVVVMQESRILTNYLLQMLRCFGGPRFAFWGHGRNYQSLAPDGWRERWKRWWLCRADWWFAYTAGSALYVQQHGFPAARTTTLDNTIDGSGFAADLAALDDGEVRAERGRLGIAADAPVAIYCGSLYADKRLDVLLGAAEQLRLRLPAFHLLVVGDGPERAQVDAFAAGRPWVHALGVRKGREKALAFRLAQVMLNPGLVGLHVVDAFVAGTPMVTQASAPHSPEYDYLEDGVNGIVVHDDAVASYAEAAARLFAEPPRLEAMRAQCAAAARRYTLENMVAHFADGIVRCLAEGRRGAARAAGAAQGGR